MRALTIRQPWAWAVVFGGKNIENRDWKKRYTSGLIAIHAGHSFDGFGDYPRRSPKPKDSDLHFGAIIGVVNIVRVVTEHRSKWFSGKYGWVLADPRPLKEPIPCKGKLGLWQLPPSIVKSIRRQLGHVAEQL